MYTAMTFWGARVSSACVPLERVKRERGAHLGIERILHGGRVSLRDEHKDREDERDDGEDGEEGLLVGQVLEGAALRGPRGAEAERDRADGAPYEERRDAGKVDEPREDDALAPDGGQERDERDAEGEPTSRGTSAPYMRRGRGCTYRSAGTGTPREVTHPKTLGACPFRASANSMRELA